MGEPDGQKCACCGKPLDAGHIEDAIAKAPVGWFPSRAVRMAARHAFAAGVAYARKEEAKLHQLRDGMREHGFVLGRNPDGEDETVDATLLILTEFEVEVARLRERLNAVEADRDETAEAWCAAGELLDRLHARTGDPQAATVDLLRALAATNGTVQVDRDCADLHAKGLLEAHNPGDETRIVLSEHARRLIAKLVNGSAR